MAINTESTHKSRQRDTSLDYLRGVMILLMVLFHVAWFADKHPNIKLFVYTFHMPVFLIISGYLSPIERSAGQFFRSQAWIFIPYVLMESLYMVLSTLLPVRNPITTLSINFWFDKLLFHPIGPYWYLHTLMLCAVTAWLVYHTGFKKDYQPIMLLALAFALLSFYGGILHFSNAFYFLIGFSMRRFSISFSSLFRPTWLAVIPLVWLSMYANNLDRGNIGGLAITFLVILFLLAVHPLIPCKQYINRIGANTLPILLFSPAFTMMAKAVLPWWNFDFDGWLFGLCTTAVAVEGSIAIAKLCDTWGFSPYLFGKKKVLLNLHPAVSQTQQDNTNTKNKQQ